MTIELIETVQLGSTTASIVFSGIPQDGTDLLIVASTRSLRANFFDNLRTNFNSGGTYTLQRLAGISGSVQATNYSRSNFIPTINAANSTANTFANTQIYIENYTSSSSKNFQCETVTEQYGSSADMEIWQGNWSSTAAITSLTFTPNNADFQANSMISLYKIK